MTLCDVVERASASCDGLGTYRLGCDWPEGCAALILSSGKRASEAVRLVPEASAWVSITGQDLYCTDHAALAAERARRTAEGRVVESIRADNLLNAALRVLQDEFVFGPQRLLGEATQIGLGIGVLEVAGAKTMFMSTDVTKAYEDEVLRESEAAGDGVPSSEPDAWIPCSDGTPPAEYLMRRSNRPEDAQIPGAVVRELQCTVCRKTSEVNATAGDQHFSGCTGSLVPRAVDVPYIRR